MNSAHGLKQKGTHHKEAVDVACLIYSPFLHESLIGKKTNILGSSIDITTTIMTLSCLKYDKKNFDGRSLLKWKNNYLKINKKKHPIINLTNSLMLSLTYANYRSWYFNISSELKKKVIYNPNNYFEYQCLFLMTVENICRNNKKIQYKFCRYYSFLELIQYNFEYNPNLGKIINKKFFFDTGSELNDFPEEIMELKNITSDEFMFTDIYDLLKSEDNVKLYVFMVSVYLYIEKRTDNILLLPGVNISYVELIKNNQYSFFCYNLTEDPQEVINLADPNYPERHNLELFENLNKCIDNNINRYNICSITFIIPFRMIRGLALILKQFGNNIAEYNDRQLIIYATVLLTNDFDSSFSVLTVNQLNNYFYTFVK